MLEWVAMPSSKGSSQPRDQPRSPTLQTDSLLSEPFPKYICKVGVVISDPCENKGRCLMQWAQASAPLSSQQCCHMTRGFEE